MTLKLVKLFLEQYDESLSSKFTQLLKDNKIVFNKNTMYEYLINYNEVHIKYIMSIDDSLAIIHEFMHYISYLQSEKIG